MLKKRAYQLLAVSFILLLFAELAGRAMGFGDPPLAVLDEEVEYYLKPSSHYRRFGNEVSINQWGMRSPAFSLEPKVGEHRAYVLGDSVVYGNHHIDQQKTISYSLARQLASQDKAYTVGAIASSSWGPGNLHAFLEKFGPFPGETAIVVMSSHDLSDVPFNVLDITPYQVSPKYGALHDILTVVWQKIEQKQRYSQAGMDYDTRFDLASASLKLLLQQLKAQYPAVLLAYHPTVGEVQNPNSEILSAFVDIAAEQGVSFMDLTSHYQEAYAEGQSVHHDAIHLSAEGAGLVARVFARYLVER